MRKFLLIAIVLALRSTSAQIPIVNTSALRFTPTAWALVSAASDSASTAWCSSSWSFRGDTVSVGDLHETSEAFLPPCGMDAIVLKRPLCVIHYLEWVRWLMEPPRAVIAICRAADGPHFVGISWPYATPLKISNEPLDNRALTR